MAEPSPTPVKKPVTKKVVLAFTYTDVDGKAHDAGSTVTLPRHEANRLIVGGLARLADAAGGKPTGGDEKRATVKDILASVGDDPAKAAAALTAEQAGPARPSLIKKLEAVAGRAPENDVNDPEKEN